MLSTVNSFKLITVLHIILYFNEYQITTNLSAVLCQNIVPQKKWNNELSKKINHRNSDGMFKLILLIYEGKKYKKKVSKFM